MDTNRGDERRQRFGGVFERGARPPWAPRLVVFGLLALLLSPAATMAQGTSPPAIQPASTADNWAPPSSVFVPATGQTIAGAFLDFWHGNGAATAYGNPITPELQQNGHTVQYLDYARFELWPDDPNGNVVHLGSIGTELRPYTVLRPPPVMGSSAKGRDTANEMVKAARAWLPLDAKAAARPTDDTWRYVPATKHSVANGFKALWERTGDVNYLGNPLTEEFILQGVTYQVFERGELAWSRGKAPWLVPVGDQLAKRYKLPTAPVAQGDSPTYSEDLWTPPAPAKPQPAPSGERWIEVNLSTQYLIAWQGNVSVNETYVSTGRAGFDTPAGTFYINNKLVSQTMAGVIGGEEYNVPDVPWVMYFTDVGHALHGTYWHNNFGTPMSHGCVNLPMDFAEWLYGWANIGTRVEIHS